MPEVHVLDEVRDPATGRVTKRLTEALGDNPGEVDLTTTKYNANGGKATEVKETFYRPAGDPRFRSNLIERETTEYGADGQPTRRTIELFNDGVNETPFSKIVYEWETDNTVDPPVRFLKFFRHFVWEEGPPARWREDWRVQHDRTGAIVEAGVP